MAEFAEVVKQRIRMCDSTTTCRDCSISDCNNGSGERCSNFMLNYPQEAEAKIMKWAKEHPIKTNADKFEEVFGFKPSEDHCPYSDENCAYCTNCRHDNFWTREYKGDK